MHGVYTRSAHLGRNMSRYTLREWLSVSSEHPLKGCRVHNRQREGEETALTVLLPKPCVYTAAMFD